MNPQIGFLLNKSLESLRSLNLESAELYLKQVIKLEVRNPHALRILGVIYAQRKQYSEALRYLNNSLKSLPKNAFTLSNIGNVFFELKQYKNALDAYDKSIKIDPKYAEAWSNKGNVLYELKHYDEAITHHNMALSLNPSYAEAWSNKGNVLHELEHYDEAISHHEIALSLRPNNHEAFWNKSLTLLLLGDFENGLPLYESRRYSERVSEIIGKRLFDGQIWHGHESLQGKTILLYGEQGLGDFIQFCRYAKLVSDLGAKVVLEVPKTLSSLMESLEGVSQLITQGNDLPFFDYQCSLLSLPLALKTNMTSIPSSNSYLAANPKKVAEWRLKLGEKTKKRVGIAWSSMSNFRSDSKRSLILADFVKALPGEEYEYICLQKELKDCDKEFFEEYKKIRFFGAELNDISDTAALVECLDMVVSSCTSIPHLSAALGKNTWILLSRVPDWRWLLDRHDSPWYPSVKLFRQDSIGEWDGVLRSVKKDLIEIAQ